MNKTNKIQHNKKLKISFVTGLLTIAIIGTIFITQKKPEPEKEIVKIEAEQMENELIIQKNELTDQAKFYPYVVNDTLMEVLAFKASDGTIRTALNTCQVCYDSGRGYYVQEGDRLICQNCGNQFAADQVEIIKGGCNPVPIMKEDKVENDTTITISNEFLSQNTVLFKSWKK